MYNVTTERDIVRVETPTGTAELSLAESRVLASTLIRQYEQSCRDHRRAHSLGEFNPNLTAAERREYIRGYRAERVRLVSNLFD